MHIENEIVEQVAQMVFSTMLGIELFPQSCPAGPDCGWLQAAVRIAGPSQATVTVAMSPALAEAATRRMLSSVPEITLLDQLEVASELANMIGGNLKSVLPAPSVLSIPTTGSLEKSELSLLTQQDEVWLTGPEGELRIGLYSIAPCDACV